MASTVLTIPEKFKLELKKYSWVNWSELAREELLKKERRLLALERMDEILSKSEITQEQAEKLSDEFNQRLSKKYKELLKRGKR